MNVDEALRQFVAAEELPRAAMQWALDHWDEAAPRFVARLRAFAAGANRSDEAKDELFHIVHLCGEKREQRAYEPICRLIGESETACDFLGDAVTTTLKGILIGVCDGDPAPLMRAVEASRGDECARADALEALGYLTRAGKVFGDDEMRAYLKRLRREMKPRGESYVWVAWAATAANLGYDDLRLDVAILNKDRFIGEGEYSLADFDQQVKMVSEDPTGLSGFQGDFVGPLEGSIERLAQWAIGDEAELDEEGAEALDGETGFAAPYVNPFRGVGRNDPCPCGSGKKYKKCCLAE